MFDSYSNEETWKNLKFDTLSKIERQWLRHGFNVDLRSRLDNATKHSKITAKKDLEHSKQLSG